MNEKKQLEDRLYLLTLALRSDEEKSKELYSSEVISPEQYIELNELLKKDRKELETEKEEVRLAILEVEKQEQEKQEQKELERKQAKEAREKEIKRRKEQVAKLKDMNPEQKKMVKKYGIRTAVLIVVLICVASGISYAFTNVIGFSDVDLADYAVISYDTDNFSVTPYLYGNWDYYSEGGYYEDAVDELVSSGTYTQEEAEALMPDETALSVGQIVTGYELSTQNEVANGDEIEATIQYDEALAHSNKINVTNNVYTFTIKGLREQVTMSDVTQEMINQIPITADDVIAEAKDDSWNPDDSIFSVVSQKDFLMTSNDDYGYDDYDSNAYGDTYLVRAFTVSETDVDDADDVDYTTYYTKTQIYKSDTDVWLDEDAETYVQIQTSYNNMDEYIDSQSQYGVMEEITIGGK